MATLTPSTASYAAAEQAATDEIGIMLVDDHAIVRQGLRSILERERDLRVLAEASTAAEAATVVARVDPDVVDRKSVV